MREKLIAATAGAFLCLYPAAAHSASRDCAGDRDNSSRPAMHRGISGPVSGRPWFQIEVAPEIVSQAPFRRDAETTDSTAVSWTVGITCALSRDFTFEVEGGASVDLDSDEDAEEGSAFAAAARLQTSNPVLFGIEPFLSYGFERAYDEFFDGDGETEHTFEGGVAAERSAGPMTIGGEAAARWSDSTEPLSDYLALRLSPEIEIGLSPRIAALHLDGEVEWRRYQDRNPLIMEERRDRRLSAFAGLQLAPLVNRLLGFPHEESEDPREPGPLVQDALLGVRWEDVNSNVEEEEQAEFKFAPAFSIRFGF